MGVGGQRQKRTRPLVTRLDEAERHLLLNYRSKSIRSAGSKSILSLEICFINLFNCVFLVRWKMGQFPWCFR